LCRKIKKKYVLIAKDMIFNGVTEPNQFNAAPAPAPGKNFHAVPAAPAPTLPQLQYRQLIFANRTKVEANF
jgi:hypothetical protein